MKNYKKVFAASAVTVIAAIMVFAPALKSHCEIPCGIYGDPARIDMMFEHIQTIEKSMTQINQLSRGASVNHNQVVRWTLNKEKHADELSDIVTQYFMKQRIKPADKSDQKAYKDYIHKLTLLHEVMIYSMKAKQTTDLDNISKLRSIVGDFKKAYLGEHSH